MTDPLHIMPLKANILLVEDIQSEVMLTRLSLDNANLPYGLTIVKYGREVIPYLTSDKPKPDLILLDMNLPDMNGFEIMEALAKHPELHSIPIVILSSRDDLAEAQKRFPLTVVAFLRKPLQPEEMRRILLLLQKDG